MTKYYSSLSKSNETGDNPVDVCRLSSVAGAAAAAAAIM